MSLCEVGGESLNAVLGGLCSSSEVGILEFSGIGESCRLVFCLRDGLKLVENRSLVKKAKNYTILLNRRIYSLYHHSFSNHLVLVENLS